MLHHYTALYMLCDCFHNSDNAGHVFSTFNEYPKIMYEDAMATYVPDPRLIIY